MSVTVTRVDHVERMLFEEERIAGALLGQGKHASYTAGIVSPGEAQRHHVQSRPDDGSEIILVYRGAFRLRTGEDSRQQYDVATEGPILVICESGTPCSVENVGSEEVRFVSVFAPPFQAGEIRYLE